jgi:RNA polymerase sigma factor (sigma-70 family)
MLIERLRAGDEGAFEAIFKRHHAPLLSYCRHMLGDREDSEDALQQCFIKAHRALLKNPPPREMRAWLYAIARNCCLSAISARRPTAAIEDHEPLLAGLSEEVREREDLRELLADLRRLPEDQRSALLLAELEDLSHEQIATIVGCPVRKVKALVYQARSSLIAERDARNTPCREIREELSVARGGVLRRGRLRRHLRLCSGCRDFHAAVSAQSQSLALILPVLPSAALAAKLLGAGALMSAGMGGAAATGGGTAGGGAVAAGGGAVTGSGAASAATGGVAGGGAAATSAAGASTATGLGAATSASVAGAGTSGAVSGVLVKAAVTGAIALAGAGAVVAHGHLAGRSRGRRRAPSAVLAAVRQPPRAGAPLREGAIGAQGNAAVAQAEPTGESATSAQPQPPPTTDAAGVTPSSAEAPQRQSVAPALTVPLSAVAVAGPTLGSSTQTTGAEPTTGQGGSGAATANSESAAGAGKHASGGSALDPERSKALTRGRLRRERLRELRERRLQAAAERRRERLQRAREARESRKRRHEEQLAKARERREVRARERKEARERERREARELRELEAKRKREAREAAGRAKAPPTPTSTDKKPTTTTTTGSTPSTGAATSKPSTGSTTGTGVKGSATGTGSTPSTGSATGTTSTSGTNTTTSTSSPTTTSTSGSGKAQRKAPPPSSPLAAEATT